MNQKNVESLGAVYIYYKNNKLLFTSYKTTIIALPCVAKKIYIKYRNIKINLLARS